MASELMGTSVLSRKLAKLQAGPRGRALRSVVRAGMKPAQDLWKSTIPVGKEAHKTYKGRLVAPGFGRRSIRVVTKLSKDKHQASAALGVRSEAFYHTWFIEQQRGFTKGRLPSTLVKAFEDTQSRQLTEVAEKLKKIIQDAAR